MNYEEKITQLQSENEELMELCVNSSREIIAKDNELAALKIKYLDALENLVQLLSNNATALDNYKDSIEGLNELEKANLEGMINADNKLVEVYMKQMKQLCRQIAQEG